MSAERIAEEIAEQLVEFIDGWSKEEIAQRGSILPMDQEVLKQLRDTAETLQTHPW